ncbi:MAG: hypothetical protein HY895_01255 [Deltaproteobacteria bacterium]|nr:hypothetical protein [Deltaproteobacteria bacterium]
MEWWPIADTLQGTLIAFHPCRLLTSLPPTNTRVESPETVISGADRKIRNEFLRRSFSIAAIYV